jgi:hypothetical protein
MLARSIGSIRSFKRERAIIRSHNAGPRPSNRG